MSLFKERYKKVCICQIFAMLEDGAQFAAIITPFEQIIMFAPKGQLIEKSILIAVHELNNFIIEKTTESEFKAALEEREMILKGIMKQRGIPIKDNLYKSLLGYFAQCERGFNVFETIDI